MGSDAIARGQVGEICSFHHVGLGVELQSSGMVASAVTHIPHLFILKVLHLSIVGKSCTSYSNKRHFLLPHTSHHDPTVPSGTASLIESPL